MGFFGAGSATNNRRQRASTTASTEFLHKLECRACPLNTAKLAHPKMVPTGSDTPIIYALGEAPGADEDSIGEQFVGASGRLLRKEIPAKWRDKLRWNNSIRCRPPKNRDPESVEIECCRPFGIRDIEESKPKAIFGFGNVPLRWALEQSGIAKWRGRRIPVKIGGHACWFFPMFHPAFILHVGQEEYGGDEKKHAFQLDLKRAFDAIKDLPPPVVHSAEDAKRDVYTVLDNDLDLIIDFLHHAGQCEYAGLDYETTHLRPHVKDARILSVAISTPEMTLAFPFEHSRAGWTAEQLQRLGDALVEFLLAPVVKIVHHLAFEMEWTAVKFGRHILRATRWEDTMSQAFIIDERVGGSKPGCLGLEFLVLQYFGFNLKKLSGLNLNRLEDEPLDKELLYNGMDAKYHRLLFPLQSERIAQDGLQLAYEMMRDRVPTVVLTQVKGVSLNPAAVSALQTKFYTKIEASIAKAKKEIESLPAFKHVAGHTFNPGSNTDVVILLRDVLQRKEGQMRDGKYTVDEAVLQKINLPICKAVLEYRKATKQRSTYIDPLDANSERSVVYADGKLHTVLNTTFAETGRLSSEDPNLQNFSKRNPEAKEVRKQIVPSPGHVLASFDYGQIEARAIAMASKDKVYCQMLYEDYDVHAEWARRVHAAHPAWSGNDDFENPTVFKKYREKMKSGWTFPLFFGAEDATVARSIGLPQHIIAPLTKEFWKVFVGVREWQESTLKTYHEKGYVELLTGRRRRYPLSRQQVFNTPIQGVTADIVLDAMNRLSIMAEDDWYYQPILQIHDDLMFDLPVDRIDAYAEKIIATMLVSSYDFVNVPLQVEFSIGDDWYSMEEIGRYATHKWFKEAA